MNNDSNLSSMALGKTVAIVVPLIATGIVFIVVVMAGMSEVGRVPGRHPVLVMGAVTGLALALGVIFGLIVRWVMPDHWKPTNGAEEE